MGGSVDVPVLVHPSPRTVLGELAAAVYGRPSEHLRVIGVTGTSGKTTTTYLVEAGLRAAGRVAGLVGTVGIRIDGRDEPSALTTPEAPDLQALLAVMVERGVDTVVMEVSSHALTLGRVDAVHFAVGGFTNLSRDHLDFHPTMEDYLDAKARLFDPRSSTHADLSVVCVDDDAGRTIAGRADGPVTVSVSGRDADWRVEKVDAVDGWWPAVPVGRPGGRSPRTANRPARSLQRRERSTGGGAPRRRRGVARAGGAGSAGGDGSRQAAADRLRPALPRPRRLRAQAGGAAGRAGDVARSARRWGAPSRGRSEATRETPRGAGSQWCSARVATETGESGHRWARRQRSWPTSSS